MDKQERDLAAMETALKKAIVLMQSAQVALDTSPSPMDEQGGYPDLPAVLRLPNDALESFLGVMPELVTIASVSLRLHRQALDHQAKPRPRIGGHFP